MSFQGAASVVFLIILVGALVGGMVTNELSRPSVALAQARADPTPGAAPTATAAPAATGLDSEPAAAAAGQQPGEGEESQQVDPAEILETLRAWEEELRKWQERLEARETNTEIERATLDAGWAALDADRAALEVERGDVLRQRGEITADWDRLAQQQNTLQLDRVDLVAREQQARALAGWGGAMLFVAVVTAIACVAMVAYRPGDRQAKQAAAAPRGKEMRPLRLRPKQTPQPAAAPGPRPRPEKEPALPVSQPGGNGSGDGRHGRVL